MIKQITDEQIQEIKNLLNLHSTIKAKKILDELEEDPLRGELNNFLRNKGRSTILKSEIYSILDNTKGGNKMEDTQEEEKEESSDDTSEEETEKTEEKDEDSEEEKESEETSEDKEE